MQTTVDTAIYMDEADLLAELRSDVAAGLAATPRWLSPRWFYDEAGSMLFEAITEQPEYYPFRAERSILQRSADDIARTVGPSLVVELGSGSSTKTLLLLDALDARESLAGIVALDVSDAALADAGTKLRQRYPNAHVQSIVGDYGRHLHHVPSPTDGAARMLVFLGSTIGNLIPSERAVFLASCADMLETGEHFLIGTDLVKDPGTLELAYDEPAGVTARFNRNILEVLRRRLDAQVDVDAFEHEAVWDSDEQWVQIALRATRPTSIVVPGLVTSTFDTGDRILTEISTKFTVERIDAELDTAGFDIESRWFDDDKQFAVTLAQRR